MKNFIYKKVLTVEDAFLLLSEYKEKARILAGGTELLVKMKQKQLEPEILIDIKEIGALGGIQYDEKGGLIIGALASIRSIEVSKIIQEKFKVISEAAGFIGSIQNRNLATLGGNLCNASPAAEMAPCLMSLGTRVKVIGREKERWIPLEEFFTGPGQTVLKNGEILASIQVPNISPRTGCVYMKHSLRKAMDLAMVSVAVALTLDSTKKKCQEIKIVLGAVAPVSIRAQKAEERLRGKKIDYASIEEASRLAAKEARPISDLHGSAQYRKEMVRVITERSINQAVHNIL